MGRFITFDKEMSTHLFKFVNKVKISFNPYDKRGTSAREIMDRLHAPRYTEANPRLKFELDVHQKATAPYVEFHFHDEQIFEVKPSYKQHATDILFDVHLRLAELDAQYEIDGKNIDEL
mmetsp:Transcript_21738/g.60409  ORF Transcript_21738/g.60409 Transcript_21738/m.60409 type:complete len:119 (-) Transcript_21738:105-461(-)|eukprot:CAMPEP_0168723134 /NCGR_PEP_ID=MMETSP0724-20121128/2959_1 /TAXON_ID=265536 /ORGANISM="Amphiprora sp., Strain CCMP467" /LENGTH=118 /DNA_ID=CAMNT_0008769833 /DNA_START=67 /DNA_END=423 /DNA_ORIENTATION=-